MDFTHTPGESQYRGSGTLVNVDLDNSVVITAGHNLWSREYHINAKTITFFPGYSRERQHHFESTYFTWSRSYQVEKDHIKARDHDVGIVVLKGIKLSQHFDLYSITQESLLEHPVNVTGYPGETDEMYTMEGYVKNALSSNRMFYDIDTTRGNSGSGVWLTHPDTKKYFCVGVHTYGVDPDEPYGHNSGTRITDNLIEKIKTWSNVLLKN
jgi:V8-like Glu-specific endopeptidase